jgi:phage-related protein
MLKPIDFYGGSLDDLRNFPQGAKREAGLQLDRVQRGLEPDNWKPMKNVGPGAKEIRVFDTDSTFRVIYVTKFEDVIFVLHCFQKKSQKTAQSDINLAKDRYKELLRRNE